MIDRCDSREDFGPDVQALVRAVGGLPRLPSDLRSRVLSAACEYRQQRARRRRALLVAAGALLLVLGPPAVQHADRLTLNRPVSSPRVPADKMSDTGGLLASNDRLWTAAATGDSWDLVDGFSRLRQDQLRVLQQAF